MSERAIWISAGLLGLAAAIGLAILTSRVSQPPVGVPGEPVSAGKQLAPPRTGTGAADRTARPATTATSPRAAVAPPRAEDGDDDDRSRSGSGDEDEDDDSSGRGRGRGRGGDD